MINNYVDYEYYIDTYNGTLSEDVFNQLCKKASLKVKANTFNRINENNIPDEVKHCTCCVIDKLNNIKSISESKKKSEKVGTWSVSYQENKDEMSYQKEIDNTINECLWYVLDNNGVSLIYRGN